MSMMDVAKYLYFAGSIDMTQEEKRYFNLTNVGEVAWSPFVAKRSSRKSFSPSCVRGKNDEHQGQGFAVDYRGH